MTVAAPDPRVTVRVMATAMGALAKAAAREAKAVRKNVVMAHAPKGAVKAATHAAAVVVAVASAMRNVTGLTPTQKRQLQPQKACRAT